MIVIIYKFCALVAYAGSTSFLFVLLDDIVVLQEAVDWLMVFQEPRSRLMELWTKTTKIRLSYIHSPSDALNPDTKVSLGQILQKWPRYKDKQGHLLVCHKSHKI